MDVDVVVRTLDPDDRERVRALHHEAFGPEDALNDLVLSQVFVHERAVNLVAELDGAVVGFVAALHGGRDRARILTLHIASSARRRGLARALLDALEERLVARRVRTLSLEVHVDNVAAQRLYEAAGFRVVERDPHAYPRRDPPDGLVMEKDLARQRHRSLAVS